MKTVVAILASFCALLLPLRASAQQCLPPVLLSPAAQQSGSVNVSGTVRADTSIVTTLITTLFGGASISMDESNGLLFSHLNPIRSGGSSIQIASGKPIMFVSDVQEGLGAVAVHLETAQGFNAQGAAQLQLGGNSVGRATFYGVSSDSSSVEYCTVAENLFSYTGVNQGDVVAWGPVSHQVSQSTAANQPNVAGVVFVGNAGGNQVTRTCRLGQVRANAEAGIVPGDVVVTSGAHVGWVMTNNAAPPGAKIGVAVESTGEQVPGMVMVDVR